MAKKLKYPKYANGGFVDWTKENKEGIIGGLKMIGGTAAMAVPGLQAAGVGLLASGGSDIVGEALDGNTSELNKNITNQQLMSNPYSIPTFRYGGKIKMPLGGTVQTKEVELEQEEVFMDPEGNIGAIKDTEKASHDNGGAKMELEIGTKVLGKMKDKMTGKTYKDIGQSLAKENSKLAKLEEVSKNKLTMNAVKAMRQKIRNRFNDAFNRQEAVKLDKMAKGGRVKYALGGPIEEEYGTEDWMTSLFNTGESPLVAQDWMSQPFSASNVSPNVNPTAQTPSNLNSKADLFFDNMKTAPVVKKGEGFNPNFLTTAMQLAPVGYNLIQGLRGAKKETLPGQYAQGLSQLKNRRFNADPLYEANRSAQQIYDYNLKESGAGAGRLGANRLASLGARMRGDQQVGATEQNYNNEYSANYAQGLFGVGAAQSRLNENYLMDQASARNMLGTAFTQSGEFAGIKEGQRNLQTRESQLYDMYANWYPYISKWAGTKNAWGLKT